MVSPFILGRSAQGVGLRVLGVRNMSVGICYGDPSTVHSSSCFFFGGGGGGGLKIAIQYQFILQATGQIGPSLAECRKLRIDKMT